MSAARWLVGANPRRTAIRIAVLIATSYVVFAYVLMPVRGSGISMEPTIETGDLMFVNRLAFRLREPRRGEIVAVRLAGQSVVYVKRLLALPGDRLAIDRGVVLVNGEALEEPYAQRRNDWNVAETALGAHEFFVVGDNRVMPMAQHDMGLVERGRLIGPVIGR